MRTEPAQAAEEPNRLLAGLLQPRYESLRSQLAVVHLEHYDILYERGSTIRHVYFPRSAVLSLVIVMSDGGAVEVATVGNEGVVGVPLLFGIGTAASRVLCQVPGEALRLDAATFCELDRTHPEFHHILGRYSQFFWEQVAQAAACNRLHSNEERMARWLLMMQDRVRADAFPLTHEFLAALLGVGRPTVTILAGGLQQAGLVRYRRGQITIVDRAGLESVCCECYPVLRTRFAELLGPAQPPDLG